MLRIIAACAPLLTALPAAAQVTLDSLLREMISRDANARLPEPAYTCRQFSSYDRASTSAADAKTWFANGDHGQFLRAETRGGRTEHVMMDATGPGAVVRFWSANPKGVVRVYLDDNPKPAIEAPMTDLLGGKWAPAGVQVSEPLSGERARGWNLYLPIPYAKRCVITSDEPGFYYQINYRTYAAGADVQTFDASQVSAGAIESAQESLMTDVVSEFLEQSDRLVSAAPLLKPGETATCIKNEDGPGVVRQLRLQFEPMLREGSFRTLVLNIDFDGVRTVRAPLGDFFGIGVGSVDNRDFFRRALESGVFELNWPMPYQRSVVVSLTNIGAMPAQRASGASIDGPEREPWTDRSMYFHAAWRAEHPISTVRGNGTKDFNYLTVEGTGVFVGDTLSIVNPVDEWWGEGDEKIFVDNETFPSHFGTGTEDYYGYAWCSPILFQHPFHGQPRCDGAARNTNWGHTTVSRVRALDAIPFRSSFKFDMEVWHWQACDVAYATTSFYYARPGARDNGMDPASIAPFPEPPPPPPPFTIPGVIECEGLQIVQNTGVTAGPQDLTSFGRGKWSNEAQLWVQGKGIGDSVTFRVPAPDSASRAVHIRVTKSWDYGVLDFSVNGKPAAAKIDTCSGRQGLAEPGDWIPLGVHAPQDGAFLIRTVVSGKNPAAVGTGAFFGLDCVRLDPAQ